MLDIVWRYVVHYFVCHTLVRHLPLLHLGKGLDDTLPNGQFLPVLESCLFLCQQHRSWIWGMPQGFQTLSCLACSLQLRSKIWGLPQSPQTLTCLAFFLE